MTPETQRIPISVRCMNLKLHSKAVFQNVGLLTNLFARATGAAANAKNEKRFIRVFQSKPFRIGTRPDVDYELIYTSETFDDVTDVCPALLAYIPTYKDLDTQLRLSIFYNSSITGGKDVILGLTNFTVSEMLRSCSYNSIGTMAIDIHSEYCTGIKAFIEIIDPLPALTDEIKLPVIASKSEKNPLTQNYVFFSDQDASSPLLKVSEQSWEPKFSGMVSLLFIENYLAAMRKSVVAWKLRQEQERIRQGKFISDSEALSYGWHVVEITVRGARLSVHDTSNVPVAPATSPQTSVPSNPPAANYSIRLPLSPEFVSDLDRVAPNAALVPASPQLERRTRTSSAAKGSFVSGRGGGLTRSKSGRLTSSSIVPSKGSQLPNKKYDELLPCTYVQVLMEDRGKTFSEPVGRTNTEYYTLYPVYGTNINAGFARKNAQQNATASQDKVQATCYEKEVIYNVFESTNRLFQPRRWLQWTQALQPQQATLTSRQNSHGEDGEGVTSALSRISDCSTISNADDSQTYTFDSQTATHTIFKMYVANSDRTSIRFDLMVETPNGQIKRMGTSVIPLSQSNNFTGWLPMTLFHTEDTAVNTGNNTPANSSSVATSNAAGSSVTGNCSNSYEFGEVLVDVKLYSPPVASSPTPLDVMDEVLHLQRRTDGTVDSLTNEMRCDYRYNLLQCYEWMWALGWTTQDPLMVDGGGSIASHLSQKDLQQIVDKMTSFVLDDRSSSPTPLVQSPTSPTPPPPTNNSNQNSPKPRRPSVTFHNSLDDSVLSPSTTSTVAPLNSAEDHVYSGNNTESVSVVTKIERSLSAGDLQDMVEHTLDPKRPTRRGSKILPTLKMDDDTDDEDDDDDDDKGSDNEELGEIDNDLSAELNNPTKFQKRLLKKLSSKQLDINDVSVSVASLMLENSNSGNDKAAAGINQPNTDVSENHAMLLESIMRMDENQMDDVIEDSVSQSNKSTANDADPANSQMTSNDQTAVKHTESKPKRRGSTTSITAKSRIDVTYNLQWISDHIKEMQSMIDEIELLLAGLRHKIRADRCFRASVYKKDAEWQMLPTNFHYQLLGIQCHRPKRRGCPIEPDETIPMDVVHSVTCGAMTPHMLKHKKGGLFHQEQECEVKRNEVNILKGRYLTQVTEATHHQQHHAHTTTLLPMDAKEGPYKTLLMLGNKVQSWETQILEVGRRRMYAMSQSISIAVNSFLLKLNLLCKGAIEVSLAEKWLTAGFLVMFEGLLSVTGHEKSMLEDTITAVDILRNYRIRLLSKKAYEGSNVSQTRQSSRYVNVAASLAAASAAARSRTTSQHSDVGEDDDEKDLLPDPDFTFQGREIRIYLSHKAIQKLPESYRRLIANDGDGAVIALFPILFTQGIDMQQTMANTFGSDMAAFELQYLVNNRALQRVNTYCHRVQPLDSTSMHHSKSVDLQQSIQASHMPPSVENHMMTKSGKVNYHPLASEIHQAINASAVQLSLKNVDLLEAVERLTVMLDGIRITFCKSGKDRTGMAVTLDQARQVSTRYGLFTGLLQHALANLPNHSSSSHNNHHHHSTSGSNNNSNNANNNGTLTLMDQKLGDMANLMRVYGTRVMVAEKNIGRPVYSINLLQARFLPPLLRPPPSVCEALLKKDNS